MAKRIMVWDDSDGTVAATSSIPVSWLSWDTTIDSSRISPVRDWIPAGDGVYDLGGDTSTNLDSSYWWRNIFVYNIHTTTIYYQGDLIENQFAYKTLSNVAEADIRNRARIFVSGTAPSNPQVNDIWFDTTNHYIFVYDGSAWVQY